MRVLRWGVAVGICLAIVGFLALRSREPGITELPVAEAINDRVA